MTAFSAINLAELPPPEVIARLNFETIFAALKADLIARDSEKSQHFEFIKLFLNQALRNAVPLCYRIENRLRFADRRQIARLFSAEKATIGRWLSNDVGFNQC